MADISHIHMSVYGSVWNFDEIFPYYPFVNENELGATLKSKILVQACLRAPHVVADEAKLAIVFTYFFLSFSSSFFFSYAFCFSPTSGILRKLYFF